MRSRLTLLLTLLLLPWLIVTAALAQPGPAATTVDTRADCLALEGKWMPSAESWRSACQVPWSRDDCLRLGGAWTQVAKAASGGKCLAPVSEWGTAVQCLDRGGQWAAAGTRPASCTIAAVRLPGRSPPTIAADTGKQCDRQQDCLHGCVYQGPAMAVGAQVPGRCRAAKVAAGCFSMVEGGKLAGSACIK